MTRIVKGILATAAMFLGSLALPGVAGAVALSCGDVVTQNTVLTADVGACSEGGLIVGADNITLDLGGHRVFGTPEAGDGIGIHLVDRSGVTITNGTASDFDAGIVIEGGARNRVHGMALRHNASNEETFFGDGISILFGSHENIVEDNRVSGNGPWDGIAVGEFEGTEPSVGNVIRGNRVVANDVPFTTGEHFTSGIILLDVAQNTWVSENLVTQSGHSGIEVVGPLSTGNVVRDNRVSFNGVPPFGGPDPAGIRLARETSGNLIEANRVHANAGHGIFVGRGVVENRILNNKAQANNGLLLPNTFDLVDRNSRCDANVWRGNEFRTASRPCTMR
jgi:parallel beta-helix repeat protein